MVFCEACRRAVVEDKAVQVELPSSVVLTVTDAPEGIRGDSANNVQKSITLESASLRAARPRYCALSNAKLAAAGVVMPPWADALRRYLGQA